MFPVAEARSSSGGIAIRYVLPVLWMRSCFHTVGLIVRHTASIPTKFCSYDKDQQVHVVGCARGTKFAVYKYFWGVQGETCPPLDRSNDV